MEDICYLTIHKSRYIMTKKSRYLWSHKMEQKTEDIINGKSIPRSTIFSITFRKIDFNIYKKYCWLGAQYYG